MKYLYVPYNKFNPIELSFKGKYVGNDKPIQYLCNNYISLDTETSHINETGWIYQWAFSYYINEENRFLVYGKKPSELIEVLIKIIKVNTYDNKVDSVQKIYQKIKEKNNFAVKGYQINIKHKQDDKKIKQTGKYLPEICEDENALIEKVVTVICVDGKV